MSEPNHGDAPETPDAPSDQGAPEVPEPVADEAAEASAEPDLATQLAERTADLQRLQAEYVNYKRRVDRDRETVRKAGASEVLKSLLTVLDDIARAEQHEELTGGFKAVAEGVRQTVAAKGVEAFGAAGEPFDPALHEAVVHAGESDEVQVQSIDTVFQVGYRVGDQVLRAATVSVIDPASSPSEAPEATPDDTAENDEATENQD